MQQLQDVLINNEDLTVIGAEAFDNETTVVEDEEEARDDQRPNYKDNVKKDGNDDKKDDTPNLKKPGSTQSTSAVKAKNNSSWLNGFFRTFYTSNNHNNCGNEDTSSRRIGQMSLTAGAQAWRERNGREAVCGVDFRTGLSGHLSLQSHHAHPHLFLERPGIDKISSHSGLTVPKILRRKVYSSPIETVRSSTN